MCIIEAELNEVVRQSLHFLAYSELMPKNFFIFFGFFVVKWIKSIRDAVVITESLLRCYDWKSPAGTYFHN